MYIFDPALRSDLETVGTRGNVARFSHYEYRVFVLPEKGAAQVEHEPVGCVAGGEQGSHLAGPHLAPPTVGRQAVPHPAQGQVLGILPSPAT